MNPDRRGITALTALVLALALSATVVVAAGDGVSYFADQTIVEPDGSRRLIGAVVLEFDGIRLEADEVVERMNDGLVTGYRASGRPVTLSHTANGLAGLASASAEQVQYTVADRTLVLTNYELRLSDGSTQSGKQFRLVFE